MASRWHTAFCLGARQGKCLGLLWENVNLDTGIIDLQWQLQRIPYRHGCNTPCGRRADFCPDRALDVRSGFEYWQLDGNLCLQRPKTAGSTRVMVMPPPLAVSLQQRHDAYLAERDGYAVDHGLVWTRPDGRPISGRDDWAEWQTILADVGIPPLTLHEARHTTGTVLLALGVPEHIISSVTRLR